MWNERTNKISWNLCGIYYINMVDISRKSYERNMIETWVDNNGTLVLNEKHISKELDHKNLQKITIKNCSDHSKHRYELVEEPKKDANEIFKDWKLATKVINFKKQHWVINLE